MSGPGGRAAICKPLLAGSSDLRPMYRLNLEGYRRERSQGLIGEWHRCPERPVISPPRAFLFSTCNVVAMAFSTASAPRASGSAFDNGRFGRRQAWPFIAKTQTSRVRERDHSISCLRALAILQALERNAS